MALYGTIQKEVATLLVTMAVGYAMLGLVSDSVELFFYTYTKFVWVEIIMCPPLIVNLSFWCSFRTRFLTFGK
jgi:hypothetical protein